jgi:predicted HD superfamily hydrolase involved in NAD metabolism
MDMTCIDKIDEYMEYELTEKRIRHTEGVVETAVALAKKLGADPDKALIAAKCHDICRKWDDERMNAFVTLNQLGDAYIDNINLSHSKAAAHVAKVAFGISDEDILNAISYHTTGRAGMSLLEKIIFIADATEPNRDYPGVEALREALEEDIDKACLLSLQGTRDYVLSQKKYLDDDTQEAIEWFEIGAPTEGYPKKKEKEEDDEFDFNNLDLSDLMMF